MALRIYSTLSRKKLRFKPVKSKKINFFVCGITPYNFAHIGHGKTYVQFDFIVKYLRFKGYKVFYLQNITDIDDRILEESKKSGLSWKEISKKYETQFLKDMKDLKVTSVDKYARATEYIQEIISQVKILLLLHTYQLT